MILFKLFVESAHRVNVLLPNGKQDLDIVASLIALRKAPANSLGCSKLASCAPAGEWSTQGPIGAEDLIVRALRTPACSRS